jgi:hypothetical protein
MTHQHQNYDSLEHMSQLAVQGDIRALGAMLGIEERWLSSRWPHSCQAWELVMQAVMALNKDGGYTQLLSAVADQFIGVWTSLPDWNKTRDAYANWSHALCHNFENYKLDRGSQSLIDYPHQREVSERLMNAAIAAALEVNSVGCLERILKPIVPYNIAHIDEDNYLKPGPLIPSGLMSPAARALLRDWPRLLSLADGAPLIEIALSVLAPLPSGQLRDYLPSYLAPNQVVMILQLLGDRLPEEQRRIYIELMNGDKDDPQALEHISALIVQSVQAKEHTPGIFVDCEGTLLLPSGKLRDSLHASLIQTLEQGTKLTLFTGGDPKFVAERLIAAGMDPRLLPVESKSDYVGKLLELVIDDTQLEYQGFGAVSFLSPPYEWGRSTLVKHGEQWRWEWARE